MRALEATWERLVDCLGSVSSQKLPGSEVDSGTKGEVDCGLGRSWQGIRRRAEGPWAKSFAFFSGPHSSDPKSAT